MSIRTTVLPRTIRRMASPALPLPRGTDAAPFPHRRRRLGHLPSTSGSGLDPLVSYQTLALLLANLNRLLCTPHAGREFEFRGTCANTVGAGAKAPPSEAKLRERAVSVGWEIIEGTVLAFDVHALQSNVVSSSRTAVAAMQSAAIWMGGGAPSDARPSAGSENGEDEDERPCPCTHCEHLLTITITLEERAWPGWYSGSLIGEWVVVGLRPFAT